MAAGRLSAFQETVLRGFFRREHRFFLTGGAALAGFHLQHRETADLDLFSTEDVIAEGESTLLRLAEELGASVESTRTSGDFRRRLLRRGKESVVVDLVRDRALQLHSSKPIVDGIPVDPKDEIFANKLCALLSRSEIRDLVDLKALEAAGLDLEKGLADGARKDAGLTPGQLSFALSGLAIGSDASVPGGVTPSELKEYLAGLLRRLEKLAFPSR